MPLAVVRSVLADFPSSLLEAPESLYEAIFAQRWEVVLALLEARPSFVRRGATFFFEGRLISLRGPEERRVFWPTCASAKRRRPEASLTLFRVHVTRVFLCFEHRNIRFPCTRNSEASPRKRRRGWVLGADLCDGRRRRALGDGRGRRPGPREAAQRQSAAGAAR